MDALKIVTDFAGAVEQAIGTDGTTTFLLAMTEFAKTCPDALQEIKQLVIDNPAVFSKLLTREGVTDAKEMITQIAQYAPLIAQMQ